MSDKKDATAPLWYSEELSVKHSPSEAIPALLQLPLEGSESPSAVLGQYAGDVLPQDPPRPNFSHSSDKLEHELTSLVQKTPPASLRR